MHIYVFGITGISYVMLIYNLFPQYFTLNIRLLIEMMLNIHNSQFYIFFIFWSILIVLFYKENAMQGHYFHQSKYINENINWDTIMKILINYEQRSIYYQIKNIISILYGFPVFTFNWLLARSSTTSVLNWLLFLFRKLCTWKNREYNLSKNLIFTSCYLTKWCALLDTW